MEKTINNPLLHWLTKIIVPIVKEFNPIEYEKSHYLSHDYTENSMKYYDEICSICDDTRCILLGTKERESKFLGILIQLMSDFFTDFFDYVMNSDTEDDDFKLGVFPRVFISSSIMDDNIFKEIAAFSNGHAISIGAGSGYNEWVLSQYGVDIYAVDIKESYFKYKFFPIDNLFGNEKSIEKTKNIFSKNGCAIYCWPFEYYHLDTLIDNGCKKIVIIGSFVKSHFDIREGFGEGSKPLCPIFSEVIGVESKWKKTKILQSEHQMFADPTYVDFVHFWEYNE